MATLKTGDKAPDFELLDQDTKPVRLADYAGKNLLVYFYPKADTPGCTSQACSVRDSWDELVRQGVAVVGISPDKPESQKQFATKYDLNFPLLADTEFKAAESYGVWGHKLIFGKTALAILRSAFLIDGQGLIRQAWYKVSPGDTVPNVFAVLDKRG